MKNLKDEFNGGMEKLCIKIVKIEINLLEKGGGGGGVILKGGIYKKGFNTKLIILN